YSPEFASMMPAVAEVEKIFKTKTGGVPYDSDSIQETIAMLVLAQAIEKAKSLDPTKVAETLHANTWDSPLSLSGKVAFVPGGQNKFALSLITQLQGGKYKKIFPTEKADTKPVFPMKPWDKR
ncbi:MAG: amino acid ABC transporter substrate-binding protein, partial [Syntrophaceae bacterium]